MQIGMRQVLLETVEWFRMTCHGGDLSRTWLAHASQGLKVPRGPQEMTVSFADWRLRQLSPLEAPPMPFTRKLGEGVRFLSNAVIGLRAMQDRDGKCRKGKCPS